MSAKRDKPTEYRVWCHCGSVDTVPHREARDKWQTKHQGHSFTVWPVKSGR